MATLPSDLQPLENIGCQALLTTEDTAYNGWLRKRHFINKMNMFNWPQVYVVLRKGCVYYFKNEYGVRALGKFSLYGYNSVTRSRNITPKQGPWAFQITHAQAEDFKRYYFAASSEREMKEWMKQVKKQLVDANGKSSDYYYTYKTATKDIKVDDVTYHEIETNIYDDSSKFRVTAEYAKKYQIKGKDEASDEEDEVEDLPRKKSDPATRGRLPLPGDLRPADKTMSATRLPLPDLPKEQVRRTSSNSSDDMPPAIPPRKLESELNSMVYSTKKKDRKRDTERKKENGPNGSIGRQAGKKEPPPEETNDSDDEGDSYWDSIYFHENNPDKASEIIRTLGGSGTFLVRPGGKDGHVLVVYVDSTTKKYQIQCDEKKKFFLKKDGPHCDSIEELMYEYHSIDLPNAKGTLLTQPFQLHSEYYHGM